MRAAVVFDRDGTLVDTMTIAPTVYVDTIRALGGPELSPDTVVANWHIGATPVVLAHLLGRPVTAADRSGPASRVAGGSTGTPKRTTRPPAACTTRWLTSATSSFTRCRCRA